MAQEADRRDIVPSKVRDVVIPEPEPTHLLIAGFSLSIATCAQIARVAAARKMHPRKLMGLIVIEGAKKFDKPKRTRKQKMGSSLVGRSERKHRQEPP